MVDFNSNLKTGALAGASTGIVLTAVTLPISFLVIHLFPANFPYEITATTVIDLAVFSFVRSAISGSIFGTIHAVILSLLNKQGLLAENMKSSIRYGLVSGILIGILFAISVSRYSLGIDLNIAYLAVFSFLTAVVWTVIWSYWYGKTVYES